MASVTRGGSALTPVTALLYAGDVGQDAREEIDVIEGGKNYGWRIMEGTFCTPGIRGVCNKRGLTPSHHRLREE